jgi:hypothetical protein
VACPVLLLHSSKTIDKATPPPALEWRRESPDPGRGAGIEVLRGDPRGQIDRLGVDEGLASEGLAAEETPPTFLQIEPAGTGRERHRMHAWVSREPLLDGGAGVAGESGTDQVQLAGGIGRVQQREEREVTDRLARRRRAGQFLSVTHPQGPRDPDVLVPTPLV